MLFDIESFDYSYYDEGSEGLKVALVHHLDMPIMRQTGFHIAPGTENQIAGEYITFDGPKNQEIKCHLLFLNVFLKTFFEILLNGGIITRKGLNS